MRGGALVAAVTLSVMVQERGKRRERGTFPRGEKRSASNCCSALSLSVFPLLLLSFSVVSTLPATDRWISSTNSSHVDCLAAWIQLSPSSSGPLARSLARPLTLSDEMCSMWREREREGKQRWLLMAKRKGTKWPKERKKERKNERRTNSTLFLLPHSLPFLSLSS